MGKVVLEGLEFFAFHGFHEEERKIGNRYSVDVEVDTQLDRAATEDDLSATVDYAKLYDIVHTEMQQPSRLLEHVAQRMINQAFAIFPNMLEIKVRVSKYNPPLGGVCKRAYIELTRKRS